MECYADNSYKPVTIQSDSSCALVNDVFYGIERLFGRQPQSHGHVVSKRYIADHRHQESLMLFDPSRNDH